MENSHRSPPFARRLAHGLVAVAVVGSVPALTPPARAASQVVPVAEGFRIASGRDGIGHQAIAHDGTNFLVAWLEPGPNVTHARLVSPDGVLLGTELSLGVGSNAPGVAFDGTNYFLVWESGGQVKGARVSPAGVVLDVPALTILSAADSRDRAVLLAFDGTNFLVVWRTFGSGDADLDEIRGARVTPAGVSLDGAAGFLISDGQPGGDRYPWVAFNGSVYLVVWHHGLSDTDIYGARVSTDGTVLDPGGFAICAAEESQDHASVASDGSGFFVAWWDARGGNAANGGSARGARVSAAGVVLDDPALVLGAYARQQPAVVTIFDGTDYLALWQVDHWPSQQRLVDALARRVSPAGTIVDPQPIPVGTSYGHQWGPTIGYGGGRYLAAWNESLSGGRCYDGCIYARMLGKETVSPSPSPIAPSSSLSESQDPACQAGGWVPEPSASGQIIHNVGGFDETNVYAVTEYAEILRNDGSGWAQADSITGGRNFSVWATGPDDVWITGTGPSPERLNGAILSVRGGFPAPYVYSMGAWAGNDELARTRIVGVGVHGSAGDGTATDLNAQFDLQNFAWETRATGTSLDLRDVWGTSPSDLYAVGEYGLLLHFDGATWSRVPGIPTGQGLNAIWGSSPADLFAVGDAGTIVHFDGAAWTVHTSGTTENLTGVWGLNPTHVYAAGFGGTLLRYDGEGWTPEVSGTSVTLTGVWGARNAVWAVGEGATILKKAIEFTFAPRGHTVGSAGVTGSVSVAAPGGCSWTAAASTLWIIVTGGASGSGNGTVTYTVAANPDSVPARGTS